MATTSQLIREDVLRDPHYPVHKIAARLKKKGIPSVSYYSVPLHLQPVLANLGHKKGDFPVAEKVGEQVRWLVL